MEKKYDTLTVSDGTCRSVDKISGAATAYKSEYVEGENMVVEFKSDRSVQKWGFLVEAIEWQ